MGIILSRNDQRRVIVKSAKFPKELEHHLSKIDFDCKYAEIAREMIDRATDDEGCEQSYSDQVRDDYYHMQCSGLKK